MSPKAFHAIIVGGGPTGLSLAHAFLKANIAFTLLELREDIIEFTGAALGIWGHNVRVLDQFDVLRDAKKLSSSMDTGKMYQFNPDGTIMYEVALLKMITEAHGYEFMLFERRAFLNLLWEKLPQDVRARNVRTGARVVGIEENDSGIQVQLEDGSTIGGNIVIGADGVNSAVRKIMWEKGGLKIPDSDKTVMTARCKCLFGCSTLLQGMGPDEGWETHDSKLYFQLFTQPGRTYWFVAKPLENPQVYPNWTRYSDDDGEIFAEAVGDHALGKGIKFRDIWDNRIRYKLANLEQGVLKRWHYGRIALVGDSCHKMTPNQALGANNAIESVCSLTNHLYDLLTSSNEQPTFEALDKALEAYQKQRYPRAKKSHDMTTFYTKIAAWDGFGLETLNKWLPTILGWEKIRDRIVDLHRGGVKLSFVPVKERKVGSAPWDDEVEDKSKSLSYQSLSVYAMSAAGVAFLAVWLWMRPNPVLPYLMKQ